VVAPTAIPKLLESIKPAGGVVGDGGMYLVGESGFEVYDLAKPAMCIYPVLTPMRNTMARLMLHEDRRIVLGEAKAEELRLRDELAEAGRGVLQMERQINRSIEEVVHLAS